MSVLVIELATSRKVSYNNGSPIASREFTVTGAATEADILALFKLDGEPPSNLPNKFSVYPSLSDLNPPVRLVAMDYTMSRDSNVLDKWNITVTYREVSISGTPAIPAPLTQLAPNDEGYLNIRGSTEGGLVDVWRGFYTDSEWLAAYNSKANGSFGPGVPIFEIGSTDSDIGGVKMDVAGRPVSIETLRESISVDVTVSFIPDIDIIRKQAGSRNSTAFLGCPVGSVLFKGATWSNIAPGKWQVSYEFAADNFYHLLQTPAQDKRGDPIMDERNRAKTVSFVQPFPRVLDHRLLNPYLAFLP